MVVATLHHQDIIFFPRDARSDQAREPDSILGGCGTPESGPFGPNPPHKTPFLAHFVAKSGPFGRFGVVRRTPLATGLEATNMQTHAL